MIFSASPKLSRRTIILCIVTAGFGCQAPRGPVSIHSDDPDLHIQALKEDACRKNTTDIPKMIEDLESDDAAIRFYAVHALREITHDDFGYRFYENDEQRAPALHRWQNWLKHGK